MKLNVFFSMLKYIHLENLLNTIYIAIKHKTFFRQNKRSKNVLFFQLRAPTHHSFTFNS